MSATDQSYKNARRLRRELSLPEKLLWVRLRRQTIRFRRQHPIGQYVLDFYCPAAKLAIEVDGLAHDRGDRPRRDEIRTKWLRDEGVEVLRIPAKDVLSDAGGVADAVLRLCEDLAKPLHHRTSVRRSPSPPASPARRS